ncbi:MAG: hypothetical protein M0R80_06275 [Proteobacteria bacterium]|jgi:hypothetical protein|nr:hypothetical protein [Pseudomonadota bacterium]
MTYNFDPERWFAMEEAAIETRRRSGELDEAAYAAAMDDLVRRYEELIARLDIRYDYSEPGA